MQLERLYQNLDVLALGVGGTGYYWPGSSTNYLGRFYHDVVSNNPNYLIINGGLNDSANNVASSNLYTAVTNLFALTTNNLPNTKLWVVGNFTISTWYPPLTAPTVNDIRVDGVIGLAATNYGIPYTDVIAQNWLNVNNYYNWMGNDNIHPTIIGYTLIASNMVNEPPPPSFSGLVKANPYYNAIANGQPAIQFASPASAAFTVSPSSSGLAPFPVQFNYTGSNVGAFYWTFGDGGSSTATNPFYTYNAAGVYTSILNGNYGASYYTNIITVTNYLGTSAINGASYGMIGDETNVTANCVSNTTTVTISSPLSASYVGDKIELFGCGVQVIGLNSSGVNATNNQDMYGTITSVTGGGTTIGITTTVSNTVNGAWCSIGHDNSTNLQNALNAAGYNSFSNNITINIPAGRFLFMNQSNIYKYASDVIQYGNITLNGTGTNGTTLVDQGAWCVQTVVPWGGTGGYFTRNDIFEEIPPIANNVGPFTIENMAIDGGLTNGLTSFNQGPPGNYIDGQGWDGTHKFWLIESGANAANVLNNTIFSNLLVEHFRGEMMISIDQSTNGNLWIGNTTFSDGNATAINTYASTTLTNDLFINLLQAFEFRTINTTNTSIFENCTFTNLTGNGAAVDGSSFGNPYLIITNCNWSLNNAFTCLFFTPADNVIVESNLFTGPIGETIAHIGGSNGHFSTGYSCSNITFLNNIVAGPGNLAEVDGDATGTNGNPELMSENVTFSNNTMTASSGIISLNYGYTTNIFYYQNSYPAAGLFANSVTVQGGVQGQYPFIDLGNQYYTDEQIGAVVTNTLSYSGGSKYYFSACANGAAAILENADGTNIPPNAHAILNNQNSFPIKVMFNTAAGTQVSLANNQSITANWTGTQWTTNGTGGGVSSGSVWYIGNLIYK